MKIAEYLNQGQAGAIPLRHLVNVTNLQERTVREMIAQERKQGTPILSDNSHGYWLSASREETARFLRMMRHRAGEIHAVCNGIESRMDE